MNGILKLAAVGFLGVLPVADGAGNSFIANSFYGTDTPFTKFGDLDLAEMVKELSGGDLVPEVFSGSVLMAPRANLLGNRDNVVQVAHHAAVCTPSELPVTNAVQELGFNYSDPLVAIFTVADFSVHNQTQLDDWKDKGVGLSRRLCHAALLTVLPRAGPQSGRMQGKRIRTAGSTVSLWVKEAGGIPVNVPSSEIYTGLQRGALDCASNAGNDLIEEVAEHTTKLPTGMDWSGPQWGFNPGFGRH